MFLYDLHVDQMSQIEKGKPRRIDKKRKGDRSRENRKILQEKKSKTREKKSNSKQNGVVRKD